MKGVETVTRVRFVTHDHDATRWSDTELALWITDGCRYIAIRRPDSCSVNAQMSLAAGTKQSVAGLTPAGLRVLDVVRRVSDGRTIKYTDRDSLDAHRPTWHAATQGLPVNWVFDNRDPKTFYVYPPAIAGTSVEVVYSRAPVTVTRATLGSQELSIDDVFSDALLNYVLHRCYSKDADFSHNAGLAANYLAACDSLLGVKARTDVAYSPDANDPAGRVTQGASIGGS